MNGIQMIADVLNRNFADHSVEVDEGRHNMEPVKIIHFDIDWFTSNTLKGIFSYWGLDWRDWVIEWQVRRSKTPGNKRSRVSVSLFVKYKLELIERDGLKCPSCGKVVMNGEPIMSMVAGFLLCPACAAYKDPVKRIEEAERFIDANIVDDGVHGLALVGKLDRLLHVLVPESTPWLVKEVLCENCKEFQTFHSIDTSCKLHGIATPCQDFKQGR